MAPALWTGGAPGVCRDSWPRRVWRRCALDTAKDRGVHRALVSAHDQVPAVAALPVDDAWSGDDLLVGRGPANATGASTRARVRQGADVLLCPALSVHPPPRRRHLRDAVRIGTLDVRVAGRRALSVQRAARLGIL